MLSLSGFSLSFQTGVTACYLTGRLLSEPGPCRHSDRHQGSRICANLIYPSATHSAQGHFPPLATQANCTSTTMLCLHKVQAIPEIPTRTRSEAIFRFTNFFQHIICELTLLTLKVFMIATVLGRGTFGIFSSWELGHTSESKKSNWHLACLLI